MSKKAKKIQANESFEVNVLRAANCDGDTSIVALYVPGRNQFLEHDYHRGLHLVPVEDVFHKMITEGRDLRSAKAEAIAAACPGFATLRDQFLQDVEKAMKFQEGDPAVLYRTPHGQSREMPVVYRVGRINEIKLVAGCDYHTKKKTSSIQINRDFVHDQTGEIVRANESAAFQLEELEVAKERKKLKTAIRKLGTELGLHGAVVLVNGHAMAI